MISYDFSRRESKFFYVFLASGFLHFFILIFFPFQKTEIPEPEPIEVEFIEWNQIPKATKKITPVKKAAPAKKTPAKPKPAPKAPAPKAKTPKKPVAKPTLDLSAKVPAKSPAENIRLSDNKPSDLPVPQQLPEASPSDLNEKLNRLEPSPIAPNSNSGTSSAPSLSEKKIRPDEQSRTLQPSTKTTSAEDRANSSDLKNRKIIYKPPAPALNIEDNTTVAFQVAVKPDGSVSDVFPIKKGNAQLEKIGKEYVMKFRFEPISGKRSQVGIIRLKILRGVIQ